MKYVSSESLVHSSEIYKLIINIQRDYLHDIITPYFASTFFKSFSL